MSDFLAEMAKSSAERAEAAAAIPEASLDKPVVPLAPGAFGIIAEIKNRSPKEGALATTDFDRPARARSYTKGGACAISVLTEPGRFDGALEHLEDVVCAVPDTPVMRKDFLVATVQVLEARSVGASGVLLIAAMLGDDALQAMLDCAAEHGMFVLLESFDESDLGRSAALLDKSSNADLAASGQLLFGVNTRDLRTLHVDPERLAKLAPALPNGLAVAESGLYTADDAATVAGLGYRLALVGTALMKSSDPAGLVTAMRDAGSARVAA